MAAAVCSRRWKKCAWAWSITGRHVKDVREKHYHLIKNTRAAPPRCAVRLNVIEQVLHVAQSTVIQRRLGAWPNGLLHGWCYSLKNGLITNLEMTLLPGSGGMATCTARR